MTKTFCNPNAMAEKKAARGEYYVIAAHVCHDGRAHATWPEGRMPEGVTRLYSQAGGAVEVWGWL